MKKTLSLILLLTLLAVSMFGCSSETPDEEEKVYKSIDFSYATYVTNPLGLKFPAKADVFILKSADELSAFDPDNVLNLKDKYTSEFFETKALLFFKFVHRSSTKFIEFSGIIKKDGKLCPVITGYENKDPEAIGTADIISDIHYAEISRDDVADMGELLVINTYGKGYGIEKYDALNGELVKEEN